MSIDRQLAAILAIDPGAPVLDHGGRWWSYGELADAMAAIRSTLDMVAPGSGARIGVVTRNRPGPLAAILALLVSGRCFVVLNPMLPADRQLNDVNGLRLAAVIGEEGDLAMLGDRATAAGAAPIQIGPGFDAPQLRSRGHRSTYGEDPSVAVEMLTSGTTGPPKRVPLTRKAFELAIAGAATLEKGREADEAPRLRAATTTLPGPISHIGSLFSLLATLIAGRRICLLERFTVEGWLDAVRRHRPKVASVVPAGLRMLLDANVAKDDLSSLVALRSGTAPLDPAVAREFLARYDLPVLQNYGATEFVGGIAGWTLDDFHAHFLAKADSTGRIQPGVAARIVDADTGTEQAPGQEGVLELKTGMTGQGETWVRTSDRAMIDADHFLYIRGRMDNAIIRGGFKIHPDEVVRVLEQHPAVREAVVVGVPDPRLGEMPAAAILLRKGAEPPSDAELHDFARTRLMAYQVPVRFLIVDELPRTSSMKPSLIDVAKLFEAAGA